MDGGKLHAAKSRNIDTCSSADCVWGIETNLNWSYYGHKSDHMRVSTVREFRDKATGLLKSKEPVLITRRGRMAGVFFPSPDGTLPVDLKRELFDKLSAEIARQIKKSGASEEEILSDFESWRKTRRESRRRR